MCACLKMKKIKMCLLLNNSDISKGKGTIKERKSMKKIINITLICIMVSVFCSTTHYNAESTYDNDIELLLIPYNKILIKLSKDYGIEMYIPEKNKEKFLNSIQNITPKEFENRLRQQYKESKKYINQSNGESNFFYPQPIPNAEQIVPAIPLN